MAPPYSVSTTRQRSRPRSYMKKRDSVLTSSTNEVSTSSPNADEDALWLDDTFCIRFLCEHDQGWHMTAEILELKGLTLHQKEFLLGNVAPYLARMLTILNHSSVPLNCQRGDEGAAFKQYLVKLAMEAETSDVFEKSYLELLQYVIGHDLNHSRGGLKKCILSGGRIRWLCPSHQKGYRVTVLTTDVAHRSRSQKTDTEYLKGLTEGLLEFRDKQPQLGVKEESQQNISDFLSVAHLDALTPRTSTLLDTSALIFRTSEADSDVFQVINQTTATLDSTSQADLGHVRESVANVLDAISESPPRESEPLQLAVAEPKVPHPSDTQKKSSLREHSQMPLRAIAHSVSSDSDTSESGPEAAISKQVEFNDAGKGKAPVNQTHAMRIKFPDSSDWDTSESRKKSATSESEKQNALTKGVLFNDTAQAEETRKKAAQRRLMELMARAKPLNPVVRPQKVTSRACVVM